MIASFKLLLRAGVVLNKYRYVNFGFNDAILGRYVNRKK